MGCVGISEGYCLNVWDEIKSDGTLKGFFEKVYGSFTYCECGWLGPIELFLVLCLLAIH